MNTDRNYKKVEELRDWYIVEYSPPRKSWQYASLDITLTVENIDENKVIAVMQKELTDWLTKYPVPLFVTAWDYKKDKIKFSNVEVPNSLIGFMNKQGEICLYQKTKNETEFSNINLSQEYLDDLYSSFEYTTDAKYDADRKKRRKQIKQGYILVVILPFIWGFVYECILYFNNLFSLLAFTYIIIKTVQQAIKFLGVWPQSKREKEKEKEANLKEHYYYYCKMNPEGFERLKLETDEKMAKEDVAQQAARLKIVKT